MIRTRTRTLLVVVALVAAVVSPSVASPAGAASDPGAQRAAVRQKKAKLAAQLNTVAASERQLLAAVRTLDAQVSAESARVASARQAVAAADAEMADAAAAAAAARAQMTSITRTVVDRAVASYMSPRSPNVRLDDNADLALAARRRALLETVSASDDDLIDELNVAREDYELQQTAAKAARDRADARRTEIQGRLDALRSAERAKQRVADALEARKRELLKEIDEQAKADAELSRIIREREQRDRVFPGGGSRPGGCIWPARGAVTSEFGTRWGRLHAGIDIGARTGSPIWAAKPGAVIFAGQQSGYGNVIILDHGGGMTTVYAHQSRLGASEGQSVGQGDVIGFVGSTGHSTGPHLHFEDALRRHAPQSERVPPVTR